MTWRSHAVLRVPLLVVFVVAGTVLHLSLRDDLAPWFNERLNAEVAAGVINFLSPEAHVTTRGSLLGNSVTQFLVAQGCEGFDVILLVVVAFTLTPMPVRRKLAGALLGALFIYLLNVLRISGLWYTLRSLPRVFETMHLLVGQTIIVIAGVGFYAAWILGPGAGSSSPSDSAKEN